MLAARGVIDLRRKPSPETAAQLCSRAVHLDPEDRALVESVFRDGRTLIEVARLHDASCHSTPPRRLTSRHLARRLKRVLARLSSPLFHFVATRAELALEVGNVPGWPPIRRRVGQLVVLEGRSLRDTAPALGITVHQTREHLRAIEAMRLGAVS